LDFTKSEPANGLSCYFPAYGDSRPSVSEEELKEKHANMKGEVLDGNHRASASSHRPTGINTEADPAIAEDDSALTKRGMILPFVPLSLAFDDIRYSVDMPQVKYTNLFLSHYQQR